MTVLPSRATTGATMSAKKAERPAPRKAVVRETGFADSEVEVTEGELLVTRAEPEQLRSARENALNAAYALQRSDKVAVNGTLAAHARTIVDYLAGDE